MLGLAAPQQAPTPAPSLLQQPSMTGVNVGGILPIMSMQAIAEQQKREAEAQQREPLIEGLAGHIRKCWSVAQQNKQQEVEPRMFKSMRQRKGEYEPDILNKIKQQGGSEIYMMLTSAKCRGASAWLRDVLLGTGSEKPWTLKPTPIPDLPPDTLANLRQRAIDELSAYMQMTGVQPPQNEIRVFLNNLREEYFNGLYYEAKSKCEVMERKIEDQLVEGGFLDALDKFIDDLTTFPAAIIKGPVVRNKKKLKWLPSAQGQFTLDVTDDMVLEWERVDPLMFYPSPTSTDPNDGYMIERHRLNTRDLEELIGVEGYDEGAIRSVLTEYGKNGLHEWLSSDSEKAAVEGRSSIDVMSNPEGLIDALQFWGTVSGKMLLDWGVEDEEIDEAKTYPCEAWLIGRWVIKATLNYHPLGLTPYFKASYEDVPGTFWGNSVADLVRDCQDMCNSAGRALANNMGIASGPQVAVNVDRLPPGEDITQMFPWKIWQHTSDPMGGAQKAIDFFMPSSNVQDLMQIYEKFSVLADEFCAIPRYMTGDSPAGGAGRTASGMSMLMNNANKSMKQVASNIDANILNPLLERLYFHNMKYSDDPQIKGDAQIVARGAASVVAKESAQVRRNEFLSVVASNPWLASLVGDDGGRNLLREASKQLDMDPEKVVPSPVKMTLVQALQQMNGGALPAPGQQQGGGGNPEQNKQKLQDDSPVEDNYSPKGRNP